MVAGAVMTAITVVTATVTRPMVDITVDGDGARNEILELNGIFQKNWKENTVDFSYVVSEDLVQSNHLVATVII